MIIVIEQIITATILNSYDKSFAIYRTEADIRIDELHILIYHIGSRMICSGS